MTKLYLKDYDHDKDLSLLEFIYLFLTKLNNNYDTFNEHDNIQCYKGKHRSLEDIANICKTYYNTNPDEVKQILLNFGEKLFPQLEEPFLNLPDKATSVIPTAKELREMWKKQNEVLNKKFESLKPDEWFEKHNSINK